MNVRILGPQEVRDKLKLIKHELSTSEHIGGYGHG